MDVTPLELGLATAALVVAFGPKKLSGSKKSHEPITFEAMKPSGSQYAAGRAPSPLQAAAAERAAANVHQFATVDEARGSRPVTPARETW